MDERTREQRIRTAMDREAGHVVPRANLWPAIQSELRGKQIAATKAARLRPRPPERRFAPRRHLSMAFSNALLAFALLVSLVVLVALPPARPPQNASPATSMSLTPVAVATPGPDLMPSTLAAYAKPLELSQTVDSYTVTLERVYFDAGIVMVSYAISGPRTRYLSAMGSLGYNFSDIPVYISDSVIGSSSGRTQLYNTNDATNQNNNYIITQSQGWQVANQVADGDIVQGIASFDPPAVITSSRQLVWEQTNAATTRSSSRPALRQTELVTNTVNIAFHLNISLTRNPAIDLNSVSPQLTPNLAQDVAGPFDFTFIAPHVTPPRIITVGQQVSVGGVSITLTQALLTPAGTQLGLRYGGAGFNPKLTWQPDLIVTPAGQQIGPDTAIEVRKGDDGTWIYSSHVTLFDRPGLYTVTISALHGYDQTNPSASESRLTGPWIFQFTVPPDNTNSPLSKCKLAWETPCPP